VCVRQRLPLPLVPFEAAARAPHAQVRDSLLRVRRQHCHPQGANEQGPVTLLERCFVIVSDAPILRLHKCVHV
jgi:hypothetical protein